MNNQVVIHGDFYEELRKIRTKTADMILTDLPYNTTQNEWDNKINLREMWDLFHHVLKDNGVVVLTSQQPFTTDLIQSNRKEFKYDLVWNKKLKSGHLNAKKMPLRIHESILIFYKENSCYNPQKQKGIKNHINKKRDSIEKSSYGMHQHVDNSEELGDQKYPSSIIEFQKPHPSNSLHPTQKPVELFEYLIKTYSNEGDTILDCCAGSGTTAEACLNTNRNYICIEKEKKYIEVIHQRTKDWKC